MNYPSYSLVSHDELCEFAEKGYITNVKPEQINGASIDVTLGNTILIEHKQESGHLNRISLGSRIPLPMNKVSLTDYGGYYLQPNEFILAHTEQVFHLPPWLAAEYKLKSSMARIGLEHLNAGWADPWWNGSVLTLELKNMTRYTEIGISAGDSIGQMIFWKCNPVPEEKGYASRGRYNQDKTVSGIKL